MPSEKYSQRNNVFEKIVTLLGWIAQTVAGWHQRKTEKAKKDYANWRAGAELRRENRSRRAELLESVDELRTPTETRPDKD